MHTQIHAFNEKLAQLSAQEVNLHYCDNSIHFQDEKGVVAALYTYTEAFGLHINQEGMKRLECSITACIKEMYFREKLMEEPSLL